MRSTLYGLWIPLLNSAGFLASGSAAMAQAVPPAPDGPAQDLAIEEIVVTAQKRAESLQRTPVAVTALSETAIARQQISDVGNLNGAVPGLVIGGNSGAGGNNSFSLRGVTAQPLPIGGAPSAVGVYLDGVYLSRPDAAFFGLADVSRIEVLRGPQGTLYGRNTAGGAINIITRSPEDRFDGSADISYGNYDAIEAKGYVGGPLGAGVSASLSMSHAKRDGFYINTVTDDRIGSAKRTTGRAKLRFVDPTGNFRAEISYDRTERHEQDIFYNLRNFPMTSLRSLKDPLRIATDIEPYIGANQKSQGVNLTIEGRISDKLELTSISSWRDFDSDSIYDADTMALATPVTHTLALVASESVSNETRIAFASPNLKFTVGINYYYEKGFNEVQVATISGSPPPFRTFVINTTKIEAIAGFGQLEYNIGPNMALVAGARYQHETRDFTQENLPPRVANRGQVSDREFTPKLGLNFTPTGNSLFYVLASKGYQGPGFNFSPNLVQPVGVLDSFDPETIWAYEAGMKLDIFDRRLRLNTAAFYYDYKNLQVRQILVAPSVTVPTSQITNAGKARIKGVEVEATVAVLPGLTLSGSLSYLDAKYLSFCETGGAPVNNSPCADAGVAGFERAGNRLQQAPKWQWAFSGRLSQPVSSRLVLNLDASIFHQDTVFFYASNDPGLGNKGYDRVDARAGLMLDERYELYVFGRNLTDKRVPLAVLPIAAAITGGSLNEPRRYGVGLRVTFP